jgi:hypothetical protein
VRNPVILFSMFSLAACGDPLADFERIENIELAEDTPKGSVLPDPEDIAPRIGVLSGLLRREGGTDNADRAIEEIDPIEQQFLQWLKRKNRLVFGDGCAVLRQQTHPPNLRKPSPKSPIQNKIHRQLNQQTLLQRVLLNLKNAVGYWAAQSFQR